MPTNPRPKLNFSYPVEYGSIKLVYKDADCVLRNFLTITRISQQSAKIEYSRFGTAVITRESFKPKYKWELECVLDTTEWQRLECLAMNQDNDIQNNPLTDYFITCYDYTEVVPEQIDAITKRPEAPTTPLNWGKYSVNPAIEYYFGTFKVLIPIGEITKEWKSGRLKVKIIMYEQ